MTNRRKSAGILASTVLAAWSGAAVAQSQAPKTPYPNDGAARAVHADQPGRRDRAGAHRRTRSGLGQGRDPGARCPRLRDSGEGNQWLRVFRGEVVGAGLRPTGVLEPQDPHADMLECGCVEFGAPGLSQAHPMGARGSLQGGNAGPNEGGIGGP